jgi:DNA-nicking Smr family endonuclease
MRRGKGKPTAPNPPAGEFHHNPFRQLAKTGRREAAKPPPPPAPPKPPPEPVLNEQDLFEREMTGVRRLGADERERVVPRPPSPPFRVVTDPDAEALAELSELVSGTGAFDLANSIEFVEGAVVGLDRRLVRRLRAGDFAYQSHIDLHRMTSDQARAAVDEFLTRAHRNGQRCVLIIHGRGLNSKDQVPVLKSRLTNWLARGTWARWVLAFTSARPCDGGAGALYVLLRRQRDAKHPMRVTEGAKW